MTCADIIVYKLQDKYLVWNADHVYTLRTKYRICGTLIGSLVRKPWQNNMHSLPLMLLTEEVYICVKHKIAHVLESKDYFSRKLIDERDVDKYEKDIEVLEHEQIKIFKKEKKLKANQLYGITKKRWKKKNNSKDNDLQDMIIDETNTCLEKTGKVYSEPNSSDNMENNIVKSDKNLEDNSILPLNETLEVSDNMEIDLVKADKNVEDNSILPLNESLEVSDKMKIDLVKADKNVEDNSILPLNGSLEVSDNLKIDLVKADKNLEDNSILPLNQISEINTDKESEEEIVTEGDYNYFKYALRVHLGTSVSDTCKNLRRLNFLDQHPLTNRMRVFEDLWMKGYYLTSAEKFGGDFLVYPNDPLRNHSFFVAIVTEKDRLISAKEVVSYGRLSAAVKKTILLSTITNDTISYLSLNWAHMKVS